MGKLRRMVTVALCLLLTAAPEEAGREMSLVPSTAVPAANNFDSLPMPPQVSDDRRVQQFVGALAGGVVGLGAGFALIGLGDAFPTGCFPAGACLNFFHGLAGTLTPLLSLVGAFAGYQVMGGDGSFLTTAVAMAPAALIGLMLLTIAMEAGAATPLDFVPYAVGAGAFLVGGAALSLHLRGVQLSSLGAAASWGGASAGRVAATTLISLLTVGSSVALTTLLAAALIWPLQAAGAVIAAVGGAALSVASAFTIYGVHRAMNGRGSAGAALAGMGVALAASGAAFAFFLANGSSSGIFTPLPMTSSGILMIELAIIAGTFFPMLALEWSHTNAVKSSLPGITFGAAPLREGGMVSAALRF